jgi:WhiB family redox-sensing transcriptional regulator
MKQVQQAKRHRGPADGRQEPLAVDPRDPDIAQAHRIAHRSSRSGAGRLRSGSRDPAAPIPAR